jgi:membrane protein YdbS with pleckstrin-like domain
MARDRGEGKRGGRKLGVLYWHRSADANAPPRIPQEPTVTATNAPGGDEKRDEAALAADEVDLWWGAYSGRAMAPHFVACALVTALLFWLMRPLGWWVPYFPAGVLWLGQLALWAFQTTGWSYRLTTRRLFFAAGFHRRALRSLSLDQVREVSVRHGPVDRLLGLGTVTVRAGPDTPPLVLEGVQGAERVAERIQKQVEASRSVPTDSPDTA